MMRPKRGARIPDGPAALRKFIDRTGLKDSEAASRIGVSAPALCGYLLGKQRPIYVIRQAIERWTSGLVKASDWETSDDRETVKRVVPFLFTGTEG